MDYYKNGSLFLALACVFVMDDTHLEESESNLADVLSSLPRQLKVQYKNNWGAIRTHYREGKHKDNHRYHNIRWRSQSEYENFPTILEQIFNRQKKYFKINISHSFILYNADLKRYRFYHPSNNTGRILMEPQLINNYKAMQRFGKKITTIDILRYAQNHRDNTKWKVVLITGTTFYIDIMKQFTIGHLAVGELPSIIKNNKFILSLYKNNSGRLYKDNLCFFRCLSLASGLKITDNTRLEQQTRFYANRWLRKSGLKHVTLGDIPELERCYRINIEVYKLTSKKALKPYHLGLRRYKKSVYMLLYRKHFCYITDINRVTKAYPCEICNKIWMDGYSLSRHQRICNGGCSKEVFKGGVFQLPQTALEELYEYGVNVNTSYIYPYRIVFDIECMLKPTHISSVKTLYYSEHVPLSVSICSNLKGFKKPMCFVTTGDSQDLINRMGDYMEQIQKST